MNMLVKIKRVYAQPEKSDGFRILIDRLWPRGLTKQKAKINLWLKNIAPSPELRRWFNHDPEKWALFQKRYIRELKKNKDATALLMEQLKTKKATLVYGAKDEKHNDAVVLKSFIESF